MSASSQDLCLSPCLAVVGTVVVALLKALLLSLSGAPPICMRALLADIMLVYGLGGRAALPAL